MFGLIQARTWVCLSCWTAWHNRNLDKWLQVTERLEITILQEGVISKKPCSISASLRQTLRPNHPECSSYQCPINTGSMLCVSVSKSFVQPVTMTNDSNYSTVRLPVSLIIAAVSWSAIFITGQCMTEMDWATKCWYRFLVAFSWHLREAQRKQGFLARNTELKREWEERKWSLDTI